MLLRGPGRRCCLLCNGILLQLQHSNLAASLPAHLFIACNDWCDACSLLQIQSNQSFLANSCQFRLALSVTILIFRRLEPQLRY